MDKRRDRLGITTTEFKGPRVREQVSQEQRWRLEDALGSAQHWFWINVAVAIGGGVVSLVTYRAAAASEGGGTYVVFGGAIVFGTVGAVVSGFRALWLRLVLRRSEAGHPLAPVTRQPLSSDPESRSQGLSGTGPTDLRVGSAESQGNDPSPKNWQSSSLWDAWDDDQE